jgi:alpha-ketoglutarate-dependent taurine dioxygenase
MPANGQPRMTGIAEHPHGVNIAVFEWSSGRDVGDVSGLRRAFEEFGLVLWRGFGASDLERFEALTRRFCAGFHGVGAREKLRQAGGDGYTSEVFRDNFTLFGHAEGNYRPFPQSGDGGPQRATASPPEICFFLCRVPPSLPGGETSLTDGVEFLESMPQSLRRRFEELGVTYEMTWDRDRWQAEFPVHGVRELKGLLVDQPGVEFRIDGEVLHLRFTTHAITTARCGRRAFATGILAHLPRITHPAYLGRRPYAKASNRVRFGDGAELTEADVNELIDVHDRITHFHRWSVDDLLLIDNSRFMHGRRMTEGDCDRVMLSRFGWLAAPA